MAEPLDQRHDPLGERAGGQQPAHDALRRQRERHHEQRRDQRRDTHHPGDLRRVPHRDAAHGDVRRQVGGEQRDAEQRHHAEAVEDALDRHGGERRS